MPPLPAYDGLTLALGGDTVRLRPSLRAAAHLATPSDLLRDVDQLHLGTIRAIITTAATDRQDATAFLAKIDNTPLQIVADAIIAPLIEFMASFAPADDRTDNAPSGEPMPWPDVVRLLYRRATGWLHWTPEAAWNATPTEISEALAGWFEHVEATTPRAPEDTDQPKQPDAYTPDRLQQIEDQGFDPAFDRAGLRALKRKIASGQ
jgi:hypothetical protein